jgi:hypothetical protein
MWFGREGRHGVCMVAFSCCVFQAMTATAYIFMYSIHKQLINIISIVLAARRKKQEEKKTIKKLVKHLKF